MIKATKTTEPIYVFLPGQTDPVVRTTSYSFGTETGDWDAILAEQGWEQMGFLPLDDPEEYGYKPNPVTVYLYRYLADDNPPEAGKFLVEVWLFGKSFMTVFCKVEQYLLTLLKDWAYPLIWKENQE